MDPDKVLRGDGALAHAAAQSATAAPNVSADDVFAPSREPFDLDERLAARVAELDLDETVRQLKEDGYGVVPELADPNFNGRLRETLLRLCRDSDDDEGVGMLLDKDPTITEAVLNPKLLAVAEVMCGRGALLSQVIGSVKTQGGPPLPLHVDQGWMPAPFPVHNQLVTFCWATDVFTRANGATKVVPKSHAERRRPTLEETLDEAGAIAAECPAGSAVVWNGSVWHGGYPRTAPGERVVLHVTYSRLALRPIECYDHLGEDWLADKPYAMRVLLGREDVLNTTAGRIASGPALLLRTVAWGKG